MVSEGEGGPTPRRSGAEGPTGEGPGEKGPAKRLVIRLGETTTARWHGPVVRENNVLGDHWQAARDAGGCWLEMDIGHFAPKFARIEISDADFETLRADPEGEAARAVRRAHRKRMPD